MEMRIDNGITVNSDENPARNGEPLQNAQNTPISQAETISSQDAVSDAPNHEPENPSNQHISQNAPESSQTTTGKTSEHGSASAGEAEPVREIRTRERDKKSHVSESKFTIVAVIVIIILFAFAVLYLMNFLGIERVEDVFQHLHDMVFHD